MRDVNVVSDANGSPTHNTWRKRKWDPEMIKIAYVLEDAIVIEEFKLSTFEWGEKPPPLFFSSVLTTELTKFS